ncbi:MAG: DUF1439 domain-containing protein [Psychromonas sp.]|nr:DUF1439 domain-containing protein [Psychromonas sp.]
MNKKSFVKHLSVQCLLLLLITFTSYSVNAFVYSISKQQIQTQIDKKLPLHEDLIFAQFYVQKAGISLRAKQNKLVLHLKFRIDLFNKLCNGSSDLQSGVNYDQTTGKFYITNLKINAFSIDKLSPDIVKDIKQLVDQSLNSGFAQSGFKQIAVYTIGDKNAKEKLLRATLKEVKIQDDKVLLILSA